MSDKPYTEEDKKRAYDLNNVLCDCFNSSIGHRKCTEVDHIAQALAEERQRTLRSKVVTDLVDMLQKYCDRDNIAHVPGIVDTLANYKKAVQG